MLKIKTCMSRVDQAAEEFLQSVAPYVSENKKYKDTNILRRIIEPERVLILEFRGWMIMVNIK